MRVSRQRRIAATSEATDEVAFSPAVASPENVRALHSIELEILGERIRRARLDRKVSQRDLTRGLFTSAYLSSLELGKTRPTYTTLVELSHRLDKSLDYFLRPVGGLLDRSRLADNDYLKVLQARQALFLTDFAVSRVESGQTGVMPQAQTALQEVSSQLVRLGDFDRAYYYYLAGRQQALSEEPAAAAKSEQAELHPALNQLTQARQHLESARPSHSGEVNLQLQIQWLQLAALVYLDMGNIYLTKEDRVMQALAQYQAGLNLLENSQTELGFAEASLPADSRFAQLTRLRWYLLANIARCYLRLNDREQALKFNQQAIELATNAANGLNFMPGRHKVDQLTASYWEQSRLFGEQGDFQQAGLQVGRGLQLCEQWQDSLKLLNTLSELASLEVQAEQYEAANSIVEQLLSLIGNEGSHGEHARLWSRTQITLVQLRLKQGQLDAAASIIARVIDQATASEQPADSSWLLYQTAAEVQAGLGNKDASKAYYQQALNGISTANTVEGPTRLQEAELYYSYGQQLREWGDIEEAFGLLEKAYKLRQS